MTTLYLIEHDREWIGEELHVTQMRVIEVEARETAKQYKYKRPGNHYEYTMSKTDPKACLTREAAIQNEISYYQRRVERAERELKITREWLEKAQELAAQ